jgi:hypothetical protein
MKICPIPGDECVEVACAWWSPNLKKCSVLILAESACAVAIVQTKLKEVIKPKV